MADDVNFPEHNRQSNTEAIRERGGAHIFYGLAEIKINENKDVNESQLDD